MDPVQGSSNPSAQPVRIFLSYAREDYERVLAVYEDLVSQGFQPWMDKKDILPGQTWDIEIRTAIKTSEYIVVFLSDTSVSKRGFIQKEFKVALDESAQIPPGQIFLIPARLDDCHLPEQFASLQWCDLFEDGGFARLVRAIRAGINARENNTVPGDSLLQSPSMRNSDDALSLNSVTDGITLPPKQSTQTTESGGSGADGLETDFSPWWFRIPIWSLYLSTFFTFVFFEIRYYYPIAWALAFLVGGVIASTNRSLNLWIVFLAVFLQPLILDLSLLITSTIPTLSAGLLELVLMDGLRIGLFAVLGGGIAAVILDRSAVARRLEVKALFKADANAEGKLDRVETNILRVIALLAVLTSLVARVIGALQ